MSSVDKIDFFVFAVAVDSSRSGVLNAIPEQTTIVESKTDNQLEPGAARKSHLETAAGKTQA